MNKNVGGLTERDWVTISSFKFLKRRAPTMKRVSEVASDGKQIFCGIDLHERSMLVGVAMDRGDVNYHSLSTEDGGISRLTSILKGYRDRNSGSKVWVAYEASGCGFRLADILEAEGFSVSVLAPTHLPTSPKRRSNKTDKRDVVRILEVLRGHVLAGNDLPAVWVPSAELRDDREIVRRRLRLKEDSTDVKNQIHGILRRYGIKKPEGMKGNWTKKHIRWLHSLETVLNSGASVVLMSLLRQLDFYEGELIKVEQELIKLSEGERYKSRVESLIQIPGVGLLTAMVFLTELGDLSRFPNRRKLANYLGLVPRSWESGEQGDRKGHISKLGPSRVRKVLNQAAWLLVRYDPEFGRWFWERTPKKKYRRKMITAVMRRLGILMWHTALSAA
jgi:transposase